MNLLKVRSINLGRAVRLLAVVGVVTALAPALVHADNVVEGFQSKTTLQPGLVVALDSAGSKTVKTNPGNDVKSMYGVVIDPSDAPLTVNSKSSQIFVTTSGTYGVLVSTSAGQIKSGDYLSISPISGIAQKALSSQAVVLGKAAGGFDGKTNVITTDNGAAIGRIPVSIAIQKNPLSSDNPSVPSFLRSAANSVANKSVPVIRIYTALLIFLISVAAALTILWSGVRSSLVSLGRNPLSKHIIFRGMYKVIFTGLFVFIIGLAGVYLLLKL